MDSEKSVFQPSMVSLLFSFIGMAFVCFWLFLYLFPIWFISIPGLFILYILGIVWSYLKLKNTFIEIKENGIQVRRGVIGKSQSLFLFSQIQDINESQSFLSMLFGLKDLSIKTMTIGSTFGGSVGGLKQEDAKIIRDYCLKRINESALDKVKKESPEIFKKVISTQEDEELTENPWKLHFFKASALPFVFFGAFLFIWLIVGIFVPMLLVLFFMFGIFFVIGLIFWPVGVVIKSISYKYNLGKTRLDIVQGIFSFYRSTVMFYKVQDVILIRSFFDKLVGLCNVQVETGEIEIYSDADTKSGRVLGNVIPSLDFSDALKLREYIYNFLSINLNQLEPDLTKRFPLQKAKIYKKTLSRSIGLIFFAILVIGLLLFFTTVSAEANSSAGSFLIMLVFFAIVGLFVLILTILVHQYYYLKSYYYNVSLDTIIVRKGVLSSSEIILPFEKIQNVFIDQDLLDKVFGLYDLHFSTVTITSAYLCHIDGLNKENAEKIRDIIAKCILEQKKK